MLCFQLRAEETAGKSVAIKPAEMLVDKKNTAFFKALAEFASSYFTKDNLKVKSCVVTVPYEAEILKNRKIEFSPEDMEKFKSGANFTTSDGKYSCVRKDATDVVRYDVFSVSSPPDKFGLAEGENGALVVPLGADGKPVALSSGAVSFEIRQNGKSFSFMPSFEPPSGVLSKTFSPNVFGQPLDDAGSIAKTPRKK